MLSSGIFEKKIATFPFEIQEIAMELRNLVAEIAPQATEKVHSRGFSYYFIERGGPVSAGICQISLFPDHVKLGFIHGAFLHDPKGILVGKTKAKRYLVITHFLDPDWDYYRYLIQEHAKFDPYDEKTQARIRKLLENR